MTTEWTGGPYRAGLPETQTRPLVARALVIVKDGCVPVRCLIVEDCELTVPGNTLLAKV